MDSVDRIYIFHLTDLHFGEHYAKKVSPEEEAKDEAAALAKAKVDAAAEAESEAEINVKLKEFYKFLKQFRKDNPAAIIHVVITGDFIYNYGTWNDSKDESRKMEVFKNFLETIVLKLRVPPDNFVFCYGNHDKSRDIYNKIIKDKKLSTFNTTFAGMSQKDAKAYFKLNPRELLDSKVIASIIKENSNVKYNKMFINAYKLLDGCTPPRLLNKECHLTGVKRINNINYVCYNSSWLCGEYKGIKDGKPISYSDNGFLSIGFKMTADILKTLEENTSNSTFNIGLIHHHVNSLHYTNYLPEGTQDAPPLWSKVMSSCQLLLVGHEHGELTPYMGDNSTYVFRAGTFLSKEDLKGFNTFNVLEVDFEAEKIRKKTYRFGEDSTWTNFVKFNSDLVFPGKAQQSFISHKVQVNEYFLIQKRRVQVNDEHYHYIPAEKFMQSGFDKSKYPGCKVVCDTVSFYNSNTLTEYLEKHALIRAAAMRKLNQSRYNGIDWVEPTELLDQ